MEAVEPRDDELDLTGVDDDITAFQSDEHVQKALEEGINLKEYGNVVQNQLKEAEEFAVQQFVEHSETIADLFYEIKTCDSILEGMEEMLRGFQGNLCGISTDIRKLQVESVSMNVKLRNRRAAERKLSLFLNAVVISPELVKGICQDPVDLKFVNYLMQLSSKIDYLRHPDDHSSLMETKEHIRTLTDKAVTRSRQFLLQKISELQKTRTNVQVKQGVLLKYKYLNEFLGRHAQPIANEVRNFYISTMSTLLASFFQGYITEVHSIQIKRANKQISSADKNDVLCAEISKMGGLFSVGAKKTEEHIMGILSLGDRHKVLSSSSLSPGAMNDSGRFLAWEDIWDSILHLLANTVVSEYQYLSDFFDNLQLFNAIFAKTIGLVQSDLEQYLATSFDIIGTVLSIRVCDKHRNALRDKHAAANILDPMFDRFNMLIWPRFRVLFDAHLSSISNYKINNAEIAGHAVHHLTRRFAALAHALALVNQHPLRSDEIIRTSLSKIRNEFVSVLNQMTATLPASDRMIFLINQFQHIAIKLNPMTGTDEAAAFDLLADQHIAAYADEILQSREEFKRIILFVKASESSSNSNGEKAASAAIKSFASQWRQGVEAISGAILNGQFGGNGTEPRWEHAALKRILMQLLTYYQRFDEIVRAEYSSSTSITDLVPIQTVLYQVKKYIQTS